MSQAVTAPRFIRLMSFLALIGVALSCVSLYEHVIYSRGLASEPSFCNISEHINCEAVNASEWSTFLGIPIASYGIFFYLALLVLLNLTRSQSSSLARGSTRVVLLAALIATLLSIGLFLLSEFVIGALCLLCIGLYLVNAALLLVWWLSTARGALLKGVLEGISEIAGFISATLSGSKAALVGALLLGVLAGLCALAEGVVYKFEMARIGSVDRGAQQDNFDHVGAWRASPLLHPKVISGGGAAGDYTKGDLGAPIEIVEFADFECPACRIIYKRLEGVLAKYPGKYRLTFKNYPLDSDCNPGITSSFHKLACFAANLTRCAGEQGRFWESLDLVFSEPVLEQEGGEVERSRQVLFDAVADRLGLDSQGLRECVDSKRYYSKIRDDIAEGDRIELTSTPTFLINGRRVARPIEQGFEAIFSAILNQSKP